MQNFNSELFLLFQNKLKVGNRRGVHLNAIPGNSRYKFDLSRFSAISKSLPEHFIIHLLTQKNFQFQLSIQDQVFTKDQNLKIEFDNQYAEDSYEFETDKKEEKPLSPDDEILQKIRTGLENLIFQNESIISEKGINTLGFGFPILVRKDLQDGQITASPILIWNIKIKPINEINTWEISRTEDDPIYINEVLINHLQSDSGISLSKISDEMLEDGKIDKPELVSICSSILQQLKVEQNLDFLLSNYEEIVPLKPKSQYDSILEKKGDSKILKAGIFSLFEVQKQNIINDYEILQKEYVPFELTEKPHFQSITSVVTDPSQQKIIDQLQTESKILIQGPPGTGKSQTLTGILINALENGQKTIVVCEKQTALEVLHNAMIERGFGNFCAMIKDSTTDRKVVVDAVRNVVDDSNFKKEQQPYSIHSFQSQIEEIKQAQEKINLKHYKLNENVIDGKNWNNLVSTILQLKDNSQPTIFKDFPFQLTEEEYQKVSKIVNEGEELYHQYSNYEGERFLNPKTFIQFDFHTVQEKINQSFAQYEEDWRKIQQEIELYKSNFIENRKRNFSENVQKFSSLINQIEVQTSVIGSESEVYEPQNWWYHFTSIFSSKKKKVLQTQVLLQNLSLEAKKLSQGLYLSPLSISDSLKSNVQEILNYRTQIENSQQNLTNSIENDYQNLDFCAIYDSSLANKETQNIVDKIKNLQRNIQKDQWIENSISGSNFSDFKSKINTVLSQFQVYKTSPQQPFSAEYQWFVLYSSLNNFQKQVVEKLKYSQNWKADLLVPYFSQLLVKNADQSLEVNPSEYGKVTKGIDQFKNIQKNYIQYQWIKKQQETTKKFTEKNKDITVAHLFNKRSSVQHKRLSLRQIIEKDIDLFTSFFPIIFTTPDACSNLFPGSNYYFDNVIFDEASQLKLEDNLPAMLKAKNIIIAGDEHQMPPSNYFSKVFDGVYEDEDDIENDEEIENNTQSIGAIESLLDFAQEFDFNKNYLDFHYRSRHPYLIDFSNHAFYQSRLKPLPSNIKEKPIEFFQINGVFEEHINKDEAQKVVEILKNISPDEKGKYPSVGIATFNITQRNYIKRLLIQVSNLPENVDFKEKLAGLEEAGLFIKNLENIQGDERDIIIISTTYGPKNSGRFTQSFGPVNHTKGYKLLNVIITRAKYKIYICNSIPEGYFNGFEEALKQEKSNNRKAVFYAYLAYCKAVSDGNEKERERILEVLHTQYLHTENIDIFDNELVEIAFKKLKTNHPDIRIDQSKNLGGYLLDIIIEKEGKKPIAIECLSKKSYYNPWAYLEDLHKEKIISQCGYEYRRLWSNDCWQNFESQISKIIS